MPKFLLLAGSHTEGGKTYKYDGPDSPQEFESPHDLDKMFANKYKRVDGPTLQYRNHSETIDRPDLKDPPLSERRPLGVKTAFSGDEEKSAQIAEELRDAPARSSGDGPRGEDVTDHFPIAEDTKFVVYKDKKRYFVYDKDDLYTALNGDELKNKTEVENFIADQD